MWKIQRYIFAEWLKVFAITVCLVMGLIMIQGVYTGLERWIERGATVNEIILNFLLTVPVSLPSVIPLALLLSVLFSANVMHQKNEIIAMRSAGMSLWKISQPLMLAAVVCGGSILALNAEFIPWSVNQQEALLTRVYTRALKENQQAIREKDRNVPNLGWLNFRDNRLWLIGSFNPREEKGIDVTVYEMNKSGRENYRIQATSATYRKQSEDWAFYKGRELFYDGQTNEPYRSQTFEELIKPNYKDSPDMMLMLRKKPHDLSLLELKQLLSNYRGHINSDITPYEVQYYRILASPFYCLLVVYFGLSFAVAGVRTNPMVGISKAIGMFLFYIVVSNIADLLGEGGVITPWIAAILPLTFVGLIAIRVFVKAQ